MPSALLILFGIPILLIGLVGMGPQVNVHRIRPWSIAAWVFRLGGALMIIGLLLSLRGDLDLALIIVSLIIGTACVIACSVIVHHEWIQAGHAGQPDFQLHFAPVSLALWIGTMVLGVILIIGLAARMLGFTLNWLMILEMLSGLGLLFNIQMSAERRRANFVLTHSFSIQAYLVGVMIMVLGLNLLVKVVGGVYLPPIFQ